MLCTVLYEDNAGAQPQNFGPHALLLACLADRVGRPVRSLKGQVVGVPKKGNGNVKRALERDAEDLANRGPLFAVFDDDQVRRCYGLEKDACRPAVLAAIKGDPPKSVEVILIEENIESLIAACRQVLGRLPSSQKPKPAERDEILQEVARGSRDRRHAVLQRCPTFTRLVEKVLPSLGLEGSATG